MKIIASLIILLSFSVSSFSHAKEPSLTISGDGWAPEIHVDCVTSACKNVMIKMKWFDETIVGPYPLAELESHLLSVDYKRIYVLPKVFDLRPDTQAGAMNLFLPFIWAVAGSAGVISDSLEFVGDPNLEMERHIDLLMIKIRSSQPERIVLSHRTFDRVYHALSAHSQKLKDAAESSCGSNLTL